MIENKSTQVLNDNCRSSGISSGWLALIIAILIIIADQALKIWVKTSFYMGEDLEITKWFHLKFIENNGMAFGLELWNKLILTFGRIIAVGLFIWFIVKVKNVEGVRRGFIVCMALITAGAAGNIFDCVFYAHFLPRQIPSTNLDCCVLDDLHLWLSSMITDLKMLMRSSNSMDWRVKRVVFFTFLTKNFFKLS